MKLVDAHGYSFVVSRRRAGRVYWRCSVRNKHDTCPATVSQSGCHFNPGAHSHSHPAEPGLASIVEIRTEVKKQARSDVFKSGHNIVNDVQVELDPEAAGGLDKPENLIRIANRAREGQRPKDPKDLKFGLVLDFLPETFVKADILYKGERHLIFATDRQLQHLSMCRQWFVDGTFKVVKEPFHQLLSIHGFVRVGRQMKMVPLVFVLMSRRTTNDYVVVLRRLLRLLPSPPPVVTIIMDFELATWRAVERLLPGVRRRGCLFHLTQAIWRKCQEVGLQNAYLGKENLKAFIRKLMALPFLPVPSIVPMFEQIEARVPAGGKLEKLVRYYRRQWIDRSTFQPSSWCMFNVSVRTNNHVEDFVRVFDTAGNFKAGPLNEGVLEGDTMANGRENELRDRVYRQRVSCAMFQCYAQEKHKVVNVIKHDEYELAYCSVRKVGCTFWKRMLLYLYNDTGGTVVRSPFEIPRMFVHYGKKKHLQIRRDFPKFENQLTNYTRFMFTRDPYSRLWSAYLDKFRLPDFWRSFAFQIVRRRSVMTDKAKTCRSDITFEEFLQFVATQSPQSMNKHWRPVSYQCDPCLFKPTVIGKMETFNDDAKYILKKIGYSDILSSFNRDAYVQEELTMLIDYNFDLLKDSFYKTCLTARNVSLLLWEVFQFNGYLPKEVAGTDAMKSQDINDKASFTTFVINFYKSASNEDKRRWKLQKATALKGAFRTLPKSVTDKLVSIYKNDFNMFGYDSKPPA